MITAPIAWSVGTLEHEGERIAYEVAGAGPTSIVFCHGMGGSHAVWFQQVPFFADRYRVITWDARGFGSSSDTAAESGIPASVRDLGALLDHLDVTAAHLVGQSMGGWTSLGFALSHAERVRTLTLANSVAGVDLPAWHSFRQSTPSAPPPRILGRHPALGPGIQSSDVTKAFLYQQLGGSAYGGVGNAPAHVQQSLATTAWDLDAVAAFDRPVLVIASSADGLFPPSLLAGVAGRFPAARSVVIDGAGHSAYFEQPDAWNTALDSFLTDHGGPT